MTRRDGVQVPGGVSDPHAGAIQAFVRRVDERDLAGLDDLVLFGSAARGEASGLSSDVDFLAVVSEDAADDEIREVLRDVAYDVMLEYGPVIEVHVVSRPEFDRHRENGHPFVRRALREGRSYG